MSRLLRASLLLVLLGLGAAVLGPRGLDVLPLSEVLAADGPMIELAGEAPVAARLASPWLVVVLAVGLALLLLARRGLEGRLTARRFLVLAWVAAVALGLASSKLRGGFHLAEAVHYQGYLSDLALFEGPLDVLARQAELHDELLPHTRTHPPGPLLLAGALDALAGGLALVVPGDGGFSGPDVLRVFLAGNVGGLLLLALAWLWLVPLFHLARRLLPDEPRAPFLAVSFGAALACLHGVAPLFDVLHVPLIAGAALGLASGSRRAALVAGLAAGLALLLAYGNLIAGPCLLAVALVSGGSGRERLVRLATAALGVGLVLGLTVLAGFDYVAGFARAMAFHEAGVNQFRGRALFSLSSPYTFALWVGLPVALGALAGLRRPGPVRVVGLALVVTLVALVAGGTTRGETERLWLAILPFLVLLAATGWLAAGRARREPLAAVALTLVGVPLLLATTKLYS